MEDFYQKTAKKRDLFIKEIGQKISIEGEKGNRHFMQLCEQQILKSNNILEIGTGTGTIPLWLGHLNREMTCIDGSAAMVKIAQKNCQDHTHITFLQADLNNLPFANNSVDLIIKRLAPDNLKEINRVLKKNGRFLNLTNGEKDAVEIKNLFCLPVHEGVANYNDQLQKSGFLVKKSKEFTFYEKYHSCDDLIRMLEIAPIAPEALLIKKSSKNKLEKIFNKDGVFILTRHKYVTEATKTF